MNYRKPIGLLLFYFCAAALGLAFSVLNGRPFNFTTIATVLIVQAVVFPLIVGADVIYIKWRSKKGLVSKVEP